MFFDFDPPGILFSWVIILVLPLKFDISKNIAMTDSPQITGIASRKKDSGWTSECNGDDTWIQIHSKKIIALSVFQGFTSFSSVALVRNRAQTVPSWELPHHGVCNKKTSSLTSNGMYASTRLGLGNWSAHSVPSGAELVTNVHSLRMPKLCVTWRLEESNAPLLWKWRHRALPSWSARWRADRTRSTDLVREIPPCTESWCADRFNWTMDWLGFQHTSPDFLRMC
jgi:hypothetical protein